MSNLYQQTWTSRKRISFFIKILIHVKRKYNSELNSDTFFIYSALQASHMPFPDAETDFGDTCDELYADQHDEMKARIKIFYKFILDYMETGEMLNLCDNTLIIFASDNGDTLSHGSYNYTLRGAKNTYFEGNQRVHAFG